MTFYYIGLIVTGETEKEHADKLFKAMMSTRTCYVEVIRQIKQRYSQIPKNVQKLNVTGTEKPVPTKDEQEIGLPARKYLHERQNSFVILLDDLEHDRRYDAQFIFDVYSQPFDKILGAMRHRASVHFLVNMLEAYYFADTSAINAVLGLTLTDYHDDVETIRHPKNDIKDLFRSFKEVEHGGQILERLDIEHTLSHPEHCTALRTLFVWCEKAIGSKIFSGNVLDGILFDVTKNQI